MGDKRLKILFISSWYPNKYRPLLGIFVKRHAMANTVDCDVSAIFVCSGDDEAVVEESVEDGIYTVTGYYKKPGIKIAPFFQLVRFMRLVAIWRKVISVYKKKNGKPDIINANVAYPISIVARWLKFAWGVPYVITEHWTGYFPEHNRYKGFLQKVITRMGVANAGAVITVSKKLSGAMQALGLKNKYVVIPNVVDPEVFTLKQTIAQRGADDTFHFIHVSSLNDAQKNINGMIRVFNKFHAGHPRSRFTIIWEEEIKEFLNDIKEPYSEDGGIVLSGKKFGKELAGFLRQADVFLLFSNYENLPCVMLESFFCGLPIIATRVGDVADYVNENNGILVDSKNDEQLLDAMEKVYKNADKYKPAEIRNMVLDKVSPAAVSKQFDDVYRMVLGLRDKQVN